MKKHPDWYREQSLAYASRSLPVKVPKPHKPRKPKVSKRKQYAQYLASPRWIAFRAQIINERGPQCEMCGTLSAVQLHHLNYERVGRELDIDIQLLCRGCHRMVHGR